MNDFRSALEELNRKLSLVPQLVSQLNEEEAKIHDVIRNCCSDLKSEVEQKENKRRAIQEAVQKLPL
jgi:hypothetical protein